MVLERAAARRGSDNAFALVAPIAAAVEPPLDTRAVLPRTASSVNSRSLASERVRVPQLLQR